VYNIVVCLGSAIRNIKNVFLRVVIKFQDIAGKCYSHLVNSGKIRSATLLSFFLPNNDIRPHVHRITGQTPRFKSSLNIDEFSAKYELDFQKNMVLILAPRKFGSYPNVIFQGLENFLLERKVKITWICLNELSTNYLDDVSKVISALCKDSKLTIIIDPLAPCELYERYRSMCASWFETEKSTYGFSLFAFLGDIWREKDYTSIVPWGGAVDRFFHVDPVACLKYPAEIRLKMVFYPFVSLPEASYKSQSQFKKKHQVFFSGQVRDSDRRWWLKECYSLAKNNDINFVVNSWYKFTSGNVLSRDSYLTSLMQSSACLGLSQRGLNHWILPARSFEALRVGTALIQQEGPNCSPGQTFLRPYDDYIPFSSLEELHEIFKTVLHDRDEIERIARNGQGTFQRYFPDDSFLRILFDK